MLIDTDLDFQGVARLLALLDPLLAQEAATKAYVDARSSAVPTYTAADYTVAANTQVLYAIPITCDGYLVLTGDLVEIS